MRFTLRPGRTRRSATQEVGGTAAQPHLGGAAVLRRPDLRRAARPRLSPTFNHTPRLAGAHPVPSPLQDLPELRQILHRLGQLGDGLDELGEEVLRPTLRILRRVTRAAKVGVNGIASGAADGFEMAEATWVCEASSWRRTLQRVEGKFRAENLALRLVHGGD